MTAPTSPADAAMPLASCPFCGGPAGFHKEAARFKDLWIVTCDNDDCGVQTQWVVRPESAAEIWNRRPAPAAIERAALERAAKVADGWCEFMTLERGHPNHQEEAKLAGIIAQDIRALSTEETK